MKTEARRQIPAFALRYEKFQNNYTVKVLEEPNFTRVRLNYDRPTMRQNIINYVITGLMLPGANLALIFYYCVIITAISSK